jgi:hypothetical protein
MKLDSRLSLGDLLLEHARQLSLLNVPQRQTVGAVVNRVKKTPKGARSRSPASEAVRDLKSVKNHLGTGRAGIAFQEELMSRLAESGECTQGARADLARLHVQQGVRKAQLLKLLAPRKVEATCQN